jgi:hypothetical protein
MAGLHAARDELAGLFRIDPGTTEGRALVMDNDNSRRADRSRNQAHHDAGGTMNPAEDGQQLIGEFLEQFQGRSEYLESRMRVVRQAVADAHGNLQNGETEYSLTNLAIARHTVGSAIEALGPFNRGIATRLMELFTVIDDAIVAVVRREASGVVNTQGCHSGR